MGRPKQTKPSSKVLYRKILKLRAKGLGLKRSAKILGISHQAVAYFLHKWGGFNKNLPHYGNTKK